MTSQHLSRSDLPSPAVDGAPPAVSLREAAEILGLSEAAVLMRVFRGSIPSLVGDDGRRRVPRDALDAESELEERPHASDDVAVLSSGLEALAAELAQARARIAALESNQPRLRPQWRRYWEAWLNPSA